MAKCEDLRRAELCRLDNWLRGSPKLQLLLNSQYLSKEVQGRTGGGHGRPIDACREQKLAHVVWSNNELLKLKFWMTSKTDPGHDGEVISLGWMDASQFGADQSGCPSWLLSTTEKANTMTTSELDHSTMEEDVLVYWIMLSFRSHGWPGVHCLLGEHLVPRCIMGRSAGKPWVLPAM